MLEAIIWILVGAFIGWHLPEPTWAKVVKAKILGIFNK
jgi:hypothetical protein